MPDPALARPASTTNPGVPHRIGRDPLDEQTATPRYVVTTLDRLLVLGYVERALSASGVLWRPLDAAGARLPEHARTKMDAAVTVARSDGARALAAARDARRARIRKQGSLPSCVGWYVEGPGVTALPEQERPTRFRTRTAAVAWAETKGLVITR